LEGATLFSTYFPSKKDLEIIVAAKCVSVYFSGQISDNDVESVRFINRLFQDHIPLEIIQLQI